jgi:membrane protein DedA with SNARE-associated domain/membrane-associated phospholipid phosphatase
MDVIAVSPYGHIQTVDPKRATMQSLMSAAATHPSWIVLAVFLVACAESLAIIGTLVPAAVVMFGAGALIGAGSIEFWTTLTAAILGATLGDALSYELGRSRQTQVRNWRLLRRFAQAIARGEAFIRRHGRKSIVMARFTGPLRAFVPLLVGFSSMPRSHFYPINLVSALLWAPAHILPGVLFGASMVVAEAVSGRLAVIGLLLVLLVWFAVKVTSVSIRFAMPRLQQLRDTAVAHLRGRHSALARAALALLDPSRRDSHAMLILSALLLSAGWLFLGVGEDVWTHDPLVQVDLAVFHFLQPLRSPAADWLMVATTEMGGMGVLLPLVIMVTLWLAWHRSWHTARYWLAAVVFAQALVQLLKFALGRGRPLDLYTGNQQFSFPSGHAAATTVILGFLAFLLSRGLSNSARLAFAVVFAVYVSLVAFSRLYLGAHWMSDVVGGVSLGLAWVALVAMVYTQRRVDETFRPRAMTLMVVVTLAVFGSWSIASKSSADRLRYAAAQPQTPVMAQEDWLADGWRRIPARRSELAGKQEERFSLQWACSADAMGRALAASGWEPASPWSARPALAWLAPQSPLKALPVLPRFDQGKQSRWAFVRWSAERPAEREVLRLWDSGRLLRSGTAKKELPLWYGAAYREVQAHNRIIANAGLLRTRVIEGAIMRQPLPTDVSQQVRVGVAGQAPTTLAMCLP